MLYTVIELWDAEIKSSTKCEVTDTLKMSVSAVCLQTAPPFPSFMSIQKPPLATSGEEAVVRDTGEIIYLFYYNDSIRQESVL